MTTTTQVWIDEHGYRDAASACGVPAALQDAVWARLVSAAPDGSGRAREVLRHGGAAVSLVAMGLFLGTSWATAGSGAGLLLCLLYLGAFLAVCELLRARGQRQVAGLLAATAVALVPLTVFALQETTHLWSAREFGHYEDLFDWVSGQWVVMEAATLTGALLGWRRYRTSFLLLPAAVAGWFASMDLAAAVGGDAGSTPVSALATTALLAVALELDRRQLRGEGFWLHLSGLASLTWTVGAADVATSSRMLAVGVLGLGLVGAGVVLARRLHLAVGGAYLFSALSWLAFDVFGGSPVFALVLAALGVATALAGVRLDRARAAS